MPNVTVASLAGAGTVAQDSALTVSGPNSTTFSGVFSGGGSLVKGGLQHPHP